MAAAVGSAAMDAEFLKRTVGEPLSDALSSLVVAQPADPIEFIGEALLDFIKRKEDEAQVSYGRSFLLGGNGSCSVLVRESTCTQAEICNTCFEGRGFSIYNSSRRPFTRP